MKKLKKTLAILSAAVMSFLMIPCFGVSATEAEEKLYTLEELFAMSDEEFLELGEMAEACKVIVEKKLILGETNLYGNFSVSLKDSLYGYQSITTENKIESVLGDTLAYEYGTPLTKLMTNSYYWDSIDITFIDYYNDDLGIDGTSENIMNHAKILYCLKQIDNYSYTSNANVDSSSEENVIIGDVTLDQKVDLYDAVWISKDLIGVFEFPETLNAVGDLNNDGMCDLYDVIEIAKTLID